MKKELLTIIVLAGNLLFAIDYESLRNAYFRGADAKIMYRIIDDTGCPVTNAAVHIWFRSTYPKLKIDDWFVCSNTNGEFTVQYTTNDRLTCGVDKEGYYHSTDRVTFSDPREFPCVKDGKWQPYGTKRTILLRKRKISERLCVLSEDVKNKKWLHPGEWFIPVENKWLGFDLELFDWVAPYGNGKCNDVLLRFRSDVKRKMSDYRYDMDVSFTNNPYAGVYRMRKIDGSEFQWAYKADTNAVFESTQSFYFERRPGKRTVDCKLSDASYLVFRTRTKLDEEGKLVSAHYGVISGGWGFGSKVMGFSDACFNPVPNDTNIEDGYYLRKRVRERKKRQKVSKQ